MLKWQAERQQVLDTARKLVEKGLVIGKAGNVSLRVAADSGRQLLVITPSSRYYESLSPDDIPVVDLDGGLIEGRLPPSSEMLLHLGIYKARRSVASVVHTHSTYASALAVAGLAIPALLEEEVAFLGGEIEVADYASSGTQQLADNVVDALGERNAVLLANHGAVAVGRSMREALNAAEMLEKAAKIYLLTTALGKANPLNPGAAASAKSLFLKLQTSEDL